MKIYGEKIVHQSKVRKNLEFIEHLYKIYIYLILINLTGNDRTHNL